MQAAMEANSEGELNYFIFTMFKHYIRKVGRNYATLNGLMGIFECCKAEFYRRIVAPYEDTKIHENGDVL